MPRWWQHTSSRFELKYLVPREQLGALRADIAEQMSPDPHGGTYGYGVWSLYYDTSDYRFYWEKIDGIRFRRKLRISHYGDPGTVTGSSTVFLEVKQRVNRVTQKFRTELSHLEAIDVCDKRRAPPTQGQQS